METKANPNPNGCYARALPDEGMFIILARDVAGPNTIRAWAEFRLNMPSADADLGQIQEALATADSFENWRIDHDGEWRGHLPHLPDRIPTPTDEISSIAGRILGSKALTIRESSRAAPTRSTEEAGLRCDREAKKLMKDVATRLRIASSCAAIGARDFAAIGAANDLG
jgi:hypothetical protein